MGDHIVLGPEIGKGSRGVVFMARDTKTNKTVAVKRIVKDFREIYLEFKFLVHKEAFILERLQGSDNIIKMHSNLYREPSSPFEQPMMDISLEYIDFNLAYLLETPQMQFNNIYGKAFIKQLILALEFCHRFGYMHRDVNPSNLLITAGGVLKLADFGSARPFTAEHCPCPMSREGAMYYVAPEILSGQHSYSSSVDIWSAGCIFGEFYCGMPVFVTSNYADALQLITESCTEVLKFNAAKCAAEPISSLCMKFRTIMEPRAIQLLTRMLSLDPKRRPTAKDVLESTWLKDFDHTRVNHHYLMNLSKTAQTRKLASLEGS